MEWIASPLPLRGRRGGDFHDHWQSIQVFYQPQAFCDQTQSEESGVLPIFETRTSTELETGGSEKPKGVSVPLRQQRKLGRATQHHNGLGGERRQARRCNGTETKRETATRIRVARR